MFEGLRFAHWKTDLGADGILVLAFDHADAKVNTFDRAAIDELAQMAERLSFEPPKARVALRDRRGLPGLRKVR